MQHRLTRNDTEAMALKNVLKELKVAIKRLTVLKPALSATLKNELELDIELDSCVFYCEMALMAMQSAIELHLDAREGRALIVEAMTRPVQN